MGKAGHKSHLASAGTGGGESCPAALRASREMVGVFQLPTKLTLPPTSSRSQESHLAALAQRFFWRGALYSGTCSFTGPVPVSH